MPNSKNSANTLIKPNLLIFILNFIHELGILGGLMDCEELEEMLNNLYLFHRFLKKNGFKYENFDGSKKITFSHYLTLMLLKNNENYLCLKLGI